VSQKVFKAILLNALPASGKSEVRNFLAQMDAQTLIDDYHIGDTLQLDDFPYVHFMRRIDQELVKLGMNRIFYLDDAMPFIDGRDWATLIHMLNEDYHDLMNKNEIKVNSASQYFFDRLDRSGMIVGLLPRLGMLKQEIRETIARNLEAEAQAILEEKLAQYPDSFENKTIVIESARGGKDGSSMPLEGTYGYQYYYRHFAPELLRDSAILYIWVTPEESRRKNEERSNPADPGSNLFHGVPLKVMLDDYGCDDMQYLIEHSEKADSLTIETYGQKYYLPIGIFDNRIDKTSFLRQDKSLWDSVKVSEMRIAIKEATDKMWANYIHED